MYKLSSFVFLVTLIAFVVFWWKKRKARIAAGADYINDQNYQKVSKLKRIIGAVCIVSFVIGIATQPELTPEEKTMMAQKQQAREEQNKEDEVRKAFDKYLREYEKGAKAAEKESKKSSTALPMSGWKFLGVKSIEFMADDKAVVVWEEEFSLLNNKKKENHHNLMKTYFRKFKDKWEQVSDKWQKE